MTLDQLVAEVAAAPTQVEAFKVLMDCLKIEIDDACAGDSQPPSIQSKFDAVFGQVTGKAHEILNAIETGKSALEPLKVKEVPASSPQGPVSTAPTSGVFVDKPVVVPTPEPVVEPNPVPNPFMQPPVNQTAAQA